MVDFYYQREKKSEINNASKGQISSKSQRRGGVLRYPLEALTFSNRLLTN